MAHEPMDMDALEREMPEDPCFEEQEPNPVDEETNSEIKDDHGTEVE